MKKEVALYLAEEGIHFASYRVAVTDFDCSVVICGFIIFLCWKFPTTYSWYPNTMRPLLSKTRLRILTRRNLTTTKKPKDYSDFIPDIFRKFIEIKDSPEKGRGIFAKATIPKGTIIMKEVNIHIIFIHYELKYSIRL
jgi:hypothetical protein